MIDFFRQKGIIRETSFVGTPQQNGIVERKNHHILNVARTLLFQANLHIEFWEYCAITTGYLINMTPKTLLNRKSHFEVLYDQPPPLNHLRTFGCLCYVHNQKQDSDKFASRGNKSVLLVIIIKRRASSFITLKMELSMFLEEMLMSL